MTFTIYDAATPMFARSLGHIPTWIDKALAEGKDEKALIAARLAPDMLPFSAQIQIACDTAKNAVARIASLEPPVMTDDEASFADLKARCAKTIAYIESIDRAAVESGANREVVIPLPGGIGFKLSGEDFLMKFALPNFFFHVTTTYDLLRANGVTLGKADFLQHMGMPVKLDG